MRSICCAAQSKCNRIGASDAMFEYGKKHPIIFEIILITVGFVAVIALSLVGQVMYCSSEVSIAIIALLVAFFVLLAAVVFYALRLLRRDSQ